MNVKILIAIVFTISISIVLVGFLTIFVMRRNSDDEDDTTEIVTEMIINSTDIYFGGPATASVITAPKICKDDERLEVKSNTCKKKY